jgi:hypothetical protein
MAFDGRPDQELVAGLAHRAGPIGPSGSPLGYALPGEKGGLSLVAQHPLVIRRQDQRLLTGQIVRS